ncbi:hypothetical protein [Paenibacillus sp. FSL K6-2859]|uniref:hypothetical protein n=1 Tax=Paenibacillus sp. FSL K6-2859 TaxID=2921482 RepID=UPI0030F62EF3
MAEMRKRRRLPAFLFVILLLIGFTVSTISVQHAYAEGNKSNQTESENKMDSLKDQMLGESFSNEGKDPSYLEKTLAKLFTGFTDFLIHVLSLKDYNELIFNQDNPSLILNTFDVGVFNVLNDFYSSFIGVSAYLAVIAVLAWAFIYMYKGNTFQGQSTLGGMTRGLIFYFLGLYLAGYLFQIVFFPNKVIVLFAIDGLYRATGWDVSQFDLLGIVAVEGVTSLPVAILYLVMAVCIGMMNYQYAMRMVTLLFLMVIFPWVSYASIFPGNQKAMDLWFRELASQVFIQAGHALGYALFVAVLVNDANFWVLFAFLIGMPTLTSLIRLLFGAPGGGTVKGGLGGGTLAAMTMMVKGISGGFGNNGGGNMLNLGANGIGKNSSSIAGGAGAMAGAGLSSGLNQAINNAGALNAPSFNGMNNGALNAPSFNGMNSGAVPGYSMNGAGSSAGQGIESGFDFAGESGNDGQSFNSGLRAATASRGLKGGAAYAIGSTSSKMSSGLKSGANKALKGAPTAILGAAGFIAGSALTGNFGGGFVGASLGAKSAGFMKQHVGAAGGALKEGIAGWREYRKDNPITQVEPAPHPLALPPKSGDPLLALPAGVGMSPGRGPLELPGIVHTPLADNSGVMVNRTQDKNMFPTFPSPMNPSGSLEGHSGGSGMASSFDYGPIPPLESPGSGGMGGEGMGFSFGDRGVGSEDSGPQGSITSPSGNGAANIPSSHNVQGSAPIPNGVERSSSVSGSVSNRTPDLSDPRSTQGPTSSNTDNSQLSTSKRTLTGGPVRNNDTGAVGSGHNSNSGSYNNGSIPSIGQDSSRVVNPPVQSAGPSRTISEGVKGQVSDGGHSN